MNRTNPTEITRNGNALRSVSFSNFSLDIIGKRIGLGGKRQELHKKVDSISNSIKNGDCIRAKKRIMLNFAVFTQQ